MDTSKEPSARGRRSKIARLIEAYNLHGLDAELEELWTADEDRQSLPKLADYFNHRLLEETLETANGEAL